MKILPPNTLGAVSSVVEERKGDCGPAVQEEVAASVGVVDGVKLEKTALWGRISTSLEGQSPTIFAAGTKASPTTTASRPQFASGPDSAARLSIC